MKSIKLILCFCLVSVFSFQLLQAQTDEIELFTDNGQAWCLCDIDYLEIAETPGGPSFIIEGESSTGATVGQVIFRSAASNDKVWGQFGCSSSWPYPAQAGAVWYSDLDLGSGTKYIRFRTSKYSPSTEPVYVKINGVIIGNFIPQNMFNWNVFSLSDWISFTLENPSNPDCTIPDGITLDTLSSTSILVSWDQVDSAANYLVRYSDSDIETCSAVEVSSETEVLLEGLSLESEYNIQVSAFCCDYGWSGWSEEVRIELTAGTHTRGTQLGSDNDLTKTEKLIISPNPTNKNISLLIPNDSGSLIELSIFDYLGRLTKSHSLTDSRVFNIELLSPGTYIVEVTQGETRWHATFVKQ